IPMVSGRGFGSIDALLDIHQRYEASGKDKLVLIVLSDFDPEGERIPHVIGNCMLGDFDVRAGKLEIIKAGVTRTQAEKYDLPSLTFAKESSPNWQWFSDENGGDTTCWELEA